jgi:hypothetical protein
MNGENETIHEAVDRMFDRHIARLMGELEDAECPAIFRMAVKSKINWLRSDIHTWIDGHYGNERIGA